MDKVKTYIKTRTVGYWMLVGAFVCGMVALIAYAAAGTNENVPSLSGSVLAGLIVYVVFAAAMLVYDFRMGKYLTAAVALFSFLMFLVVEIPYITQLITTQFMGYNDQFAWHASFFLTAIFSAVAFGLTTASAVMAGSGLAREKKDKKKNMTVETEASDAEEAEA